MTDNVPITGDVRPRSETDELTDRVRAGELKNYFRMTTAINGRLAKGLRPKRLDVDELRLILRDTGQKVLKRRVSAYLMRIGSPEPDPFLDGMDAFWAARDDGEMRTGDGYVPFKAGGRMSCPHPFGSQERRKWLAGWNAAWKLASGELEFLLAEAAGAR